MLTKVKGKTSREDEHRPEMDRMTAGTVMGGPNKDTKTISPQEMLATIDRTTREMTDVGITTHRNDPHMNRGPPATRISI
jgi:hypothetical protein